MTLTHNTIAGVSVLWTPIVKDAFEFARENGDALTFNHVVRSWLFGTLIISRDEQLQESVDLEAHAVATLLHDLGWDERPNSTLITQERRFEVDGAIAAREFVRGHPEGKNWDERKVQLMWDSIALHTEPAFWRYKEPNVSSTALGIGQDFIPPGSSVTEKEYDEIWAAYPGPTMAELATNKMIWLCKTKPESTYESWLQPFGEQFVLGYDATGHRRIDRFKLTRPGRGAT